MKNASKVSSLLVITFGINLPESSIAQNTYPPIVPVRVQVPTLLRFGTDFSKIKGKGIVIPTVQKQDGHD
jgi:hypothetical protein